MQKCVGAMVLKSIRVVLVTENDFDEVEGDPDAEEPRRSYSPRVKKGHKNIVKICSK